MATTRNHNQHGDYLCKKKEIEKSLDYRINSVFSKQRKPNHLMVLGSIPSKMAPSHFSYNPTDVESVLRGIHSCNLEGPSFRAELEPKNFYTFELFDNHLRNHVQVPPSFVHDKNERFGIHNI
ncbi:MAG: hypothetical protein CMP11_00340 [Zetaproteobacteria bacterium]|nr:hypothetical protein [Pseudobdellovibrionaceae bacterium]